ncbi:GntR family transcriptional regulator [Aeromicrobium terrae]|uniref:GntR family transcriptional regulator n=1 Tax=Aeromicrobium terrae TaxID=2498846 RepID=A0A5C8NFA7_9ACTN|nr:GntR family transcriptional regulator [Aeromicrobium terrae]
MNLVSIDIESSEPPYEQVRRQIAEAAAAGALAPGHKLPTVRRLAGDLKLATNTVARAYRELEVDGVVETHGRNGTLIATRRIGDTDAADAAAAYVHVVRSRGLSIEEAQRLVETCWLRP